MGIVYRALDRELDRRVAVKVLNPQLSQNLQFTERFRREVRSVARLDHQNIARVYDVGTDNGIYFFVMQLVEGTSVSNLIKRNGIKFPLDQILLIIAQVSSALDYAHSRGIYHLDIKPENILIDNNGNALLVDFGIALAAEEVTVGHGIAGTPEYMAPEQFKGETLSARTDQYSLALVMYEMLTGRTPFRTESRSWTSMETAHLHYHPPDPNQIRPGVPPHITHALLKALDKNPRKRFARCSDFARSLGAGAYRVSASGSNLKEKLIPILLILVSVIILMVIFTVHFPGDETPDEDHGGQIVIPITYVEIEDETQYPHQQPENRHVRYEPGQDRDEPEIEIGYISAPSTMFVGNSYPVSIDGPDDDVFYTWSSDPPDIGVFSASNLKSPRFTLIDSTGSGRLALRCEVELPDGSNVWRATEVKSDVEVVQEADVETQIMDLVYGYGEAIENEDIDTLSTMYAESLRFHTNPEYTKRQVIESKNAAFEMYETLQMDISNLDLMVGRVLCRATFEKYFYFTEADGGVFSGGVVSVLEFKMIDGNWLIIAEYDIAQIGN